MEIQIAVAKTNKFGTDESGDTIEIIERATGGVSVVLCDGKESGRLGKVTSSMVVRRVIGFLADGVRDGAAARAASDFLYAERHGEVSVYLNILSADLETNTLVITRNNPAPIFLAQGDRVECLASPGEPIGQARNVRPSITEIPLKPGITIVMYTDGLITAGNTYGTQMDICTLLEALLEEQEPSAQAIADTLLSQAIRLDQFQPKDDMSVAVLRVTTEPGEHEPIRRMIVRFPITPTLDDAG
jgi:hypothetical protein